VALGRPLAKLTRGSPTVPCAWRRAAHPLAARFRATARIRRIQISSRPRAARLWRGIRAGRLSPSEPSGSRPEPGTPMGLPDAEVAGATAAGLALIAMLAWLSLYLRVAAPVDRTLTAAAIAHVRPGNTRSLPMW
jgi:hypothetical protein